MEIKVYKEGMTPKEQADVAYFERNMLALFLATMKRSTSGWYYDTENNWDGWKRVISIKSGSITFHIPDDFDVGNLPEIEPNWDGHTTQEKWAKIMKYCGCKKKKVDKSYKKDCVGRMDVLDMVLWGMNHDLIVCASKQDPKSEESYKINTSMFKNSGDLNRWHFRTKNRICNEKNGYTLKYYLVRKED